MPIDSSNNFSRPANRFFPVHQRNSSSKGRNENNNYVNKREFFNNNQKDNELPSVNHFSRWEPQNTTTGLTNNNNYRNNQTPQRSPHSEMDTTTTTKQPTVEAPISLREKRKNNEYESPLARVRY